MENKKPVLDYRAPGTPTGTTVFQAIRRRDSLRRLAVAAKFVIGLPIPFLMPALIAGGLVYSPRHRHGFLWPIPWGQTFLLLSAICVPWLFWMEWRYRGRFFEEHAPDWSDRPSSYGEWEMRYQAAQAIAWMEILLLGPRLVMEAYATSRHRKALGEVDLALAATLLSRLLEFPGGIEIWTHLRRDEPPVPLHRAIAYLVMYDWIGVSKDGTRAGR